LNSTVNLGTSGLGPISDILPNKTSINCGNSSILCFLINLPTLVILGSSSSAHFCPLASASILIDLSLCIFISLPFFPTLTCEKIGYPFESILIIIEKIKIRINAGINTTKEKIISTNLLKNSYTYFGL